MHLILITSAVVAASVFTWPRLWQELLSTNFLPHAFCYLSSSPLIWVHVISDGLIGLAYLAISITLGCLIYKTRREIPFHSMFVAFGVFIVACGGTHIMEVITTWVPMYVLSGAVKVFTALASVTTAVVLPFTAAGTVELVRQAKATQEATECLRASEERKGALLREVHHRVKNNLAVICSILYLQSTHSQEPQAIEIFRDMENRVHSMALVHESLYSSENLACIDFAQYARTLAKDILASYETPEARVELNTDLENVTMAVDLALPCGMILNELISNAFKHGIPNVPGEIKLTLRKGPLGECTLTVADNGAGIPPGLDVNSGKSLGLRLVRILARQIRGSFELIPCNSGTIANLSFVVD